jgi:hypothetical protein
LCFRREKNPESQVRRIQRWRLTDDMAGGPAVETGAQRVKVHGGRLMVAMPNAGQTPDGTWIPMYQESEEIKEKPLDYDTEYSIASTIDLIQLSAEGHEEVLSYGKDGARNSSRLRLSPQQFYEPQTIEGIDI